MRHSSHTIDHRTTEKHSQLASLSIYKQAHNQLCNFSHIAKKQWKLALKA